MSDLTIPITLFEGAPNWYVRYVEPVIEEKAERRAKEFAAYAVWRCALESSVSYADIYDGWIAVSRRNELRDRHRREPDPQAPQAQA